MGTFWHGDVLAWGRFDRIPKKLIHVQDYQLVALKKFLYKNNLHKGPSKS
jgi:hypothetical protein